MAQLTSAFFQKILAIEGGYQNRADDTGNYACGQLIGTKYGVSAGAYQTWTGHCPTVAEIRDMETATAFNFYAWYFNLYNLYPIQAQQFFELLANNTMGSPANAAKVEQRALNKLGYSLAVDGVRGPATIAALNDAWQKNPAQIYNLIRQDWIEYLQSLNKPQFIQGWLYRLENYFPPIGAAAGIGMGAVVIGLILLYLTKNKRA